MNGKIYTDSEVGEVKLVRSVRARRISIRVHPVKGVTVTVPCFAGYDSGLKFYLSRRDWVIKAVQRQKRNICDCIHLAPEQVERLRAQAKEYLPSRLAFLAAKYGFVYNRVTIKHNRSNWGSCSTRGNINLNLNLMRLPVLLADYVLLHELCHLRHPDHGGDFHALLETILQWPCRLLRHTGFSVSFRKPSRQAAPHALSAILWSAPSDATVWDDVCRFGYGSYFIRFLFSGQDVQNTSRIL